ncbi:MAG: TIM barrel protein [Phycisphaerales bacterium]
MLLTLGVNSIRSMLKGRGSARPALELTDIPRYARDELGLNGLTMTTDLLAGATREQIASLRDAGDKAGCATLLLVEPDPLPIAEPSEKKGEQGVERMIRVVRAAQLLGCSSAAMSVKGKDDDETFERAAERIREVVDHAERLEVNLLIRPAKGLTEKPDRLIELIKKVGGFRIGSLPDFQDAAASGDPAAYLRRITPYASALLASTVELEQPEAGEPEPAKKKPKKKAAAKAPPADEGDDDAGDDEPIVEGESLPEDEVLDIESLLDVPPPIHRPYELTPLIEAILSVGYDQALTIDYRGEGDGTLGVMLSRDAVEAAIESLAQQG